MTSRLTELQDVIEKLAVGHTAPIAVSPGVQVFASPQVTTQLAAIAEANVALVARGAKRTFLGDEVFDYSAGQFLAVTVDVPLTSWITEASRESPFLAVGITLDPALIAELRLDERAAPAPRANTRAVGEFDATPEFIDAVVRLLYTIQSPPDYRVLGDAIMREIHWRLLTGSQGAMIRELGRADGDLAAVARATAWLRANYDRPFRAESLARAVGLSVSSVNRSFRRATSLSPLQYQKKIRLHHAWLRLLAGETDIARIGYAVGYTSASQFTREFKRHFGHAPSETPPDYREPRSGR